MRARFGRMVMCHMVADTEDELHAMARIIGVPRRWYQGDHHDICRSKRERAIRAGAVEITYRQAGLMVAVWRRTGKLPAPDQAEAEWQAVRRRVSAA